MHAGKDRLLLVDGQPVFREGLASELRRHLHDLHVQEVCAIDDALAALAEPGRLCLIVYDWHLAKAGGRTGLNALLGNGVNCPVLVMCAGVHEITPLSGLALGVADIAPKSMRAAELRARVEILLRHRPERAVPRLTTREREVLRLIHRGRTNKQIASQLGIRASTVRDHVSRILQALGASNRTEAAVRALALGLLADL